MAHRIAVFLMLLAAVQLIGLPWAGLFAASKAAQTYRNAKHHGLLAALKSIPKGKGTCGTCKKIRYAKAQADQQREPLQSSLQWTPAVLPVIVTVRPPWLADREPAVTLHVWAVRAESPPHLPPRPV